MTLIEDALQSTEGDKREGVATGIGTTAAAGAVQGAAATQGISATAASLTGGTAGAAGAGALAAIQAAAPIMALIAIYSGYRGYRDARKAAGTSLTEDEISSAVDFLGIDSFLDKAIPKELPEELNPFNLVGELLSIGGKHEDQLIRDRWRNGLEKAGFAAKAENGSHYLELADGTMYDIGLDGRAEIPTFDPGAAVDDLGPGRMRPYDMDTSNPLTQQAIGFMNPLAAMTAGGQDKIGSDAAGILANATLANADTIEQVQENARHFYEQIFGAAAAEQGISTQEMTLGSLQTLYDMEHITEEQFLAYSNGIRQTFGTAELTPPGTPLEADPAQPEGVASADTTRGFINNTVTAGVILDAEVNTIGSASPDITRSTGDTNNLVPRTQATRVLTQQPGAAPSPRPTADIPTTEVGNVQAPSEGTTSQVTPQIQTSKPNRHPDDTSVTISTPGESNVKATGERTPSIPVSLLGQPTKGVPGPTEGAPVSETQFLRNIPAEAGQPAKPIASKEELGIAPDPVNPETGTTQSATYEEAQALLDKKFEQEQQLQAEAHSNALAATRKGIIANLAIQEHNKMSSGGSGLTLLGRSRAAPAAANLTGTIGAGYAG